MVFEQRHEMRLETVHPSGAEEWLCPECGRRFIAQWEPKFRRVVLHQGDENIIHVGQAMGLLEGTSESFSEENPVDAPDLQDVWKQVLNKLDFDEEDRDSSDEQENDAL